jgi:hypothetical protein
MAAQFKMQRQLALQAQAQALYQQRLLAAQREFARRQAAQAATADQSDSSPTTRRQARSRRQRSTVAVAARPGMTERERQLLRSGRAKP